MKKLLFFLCVTLTLSACKKEQDDITPRGTASEVAGTYELTTFRFQNNDDDLNIPKMPVIQQGKQTYFGSVELTEATDPDQTQMVLKLTLDSQAFDDIAFGEVDVEKSGTKYNLLSDGQKIGSISGSTLQFDIQTTDARMAFTAKR